MQDNADIPNFVILTPGRSGSQLLVSLLDSHPDIRCVGEMVGAEPITPHDPRNELRTVLDKTRELRNVTSKTFFGFKLPIWCLVDPSRLLTDLFERGTRCVVLFRTNKLDMIISQYLAIANSSWSSAGRYSIQSVELDRNSLVGELAALEKVDRRMLDMTRSRPRIIATYESIVGDPTIPWIQDFLGVELQPLHATTTRARAGSQRHTVRNFEEIQELLAHTKYRGYLDSGA